MSLIMIYSSRNFIYRRQLRKIIRDRRKSLLQEQRDLLSQQAAVRILSFPHLLRAKTVAVFLSFDGEIDTRPLIEQLWRIGKKTYLPSVHTSNPGNLLFLHYHSRSRLVMNQFKIYEPKLDVRDILSLRDLNLLITPLVAFDKSGQRLGMGGGFYDRVLQHWEKFGFYPIGYAYDCQLVNTFPVEKWDIPLPTIATPSKLWLW